MRTNHKRSVREFKEGLLFSSITADTRIPYSARTAT